VRATSNEATNTHAITTPATIIDLSTGRDARSGATS
jgi:hypothetical protein